MTAPKVSPEDLDADIVGETYTLLPNGRTLVCQLALKNGFTVEGQAACVSAENFNLDIGKKISYANAKDKLWQLLGFRLADKLVTLTGITDPQEAMAAMPGVRIYIGTKVIYAAPMNRADFNILRGWELPENERGEDEGYLVEYADGGATNAAGFAGYISWSPKDVFESSYKPVDYVPPAPNYVDRLRTELVELIGRHTKLVSFINTDAWQALGFEDQSDLEVQRDYMEKYAVVLQRRLGRAEQNSGAV